MLYASFADTCFEVSPLNNAIRPSFTGEVIFTSQNDLTLFMAS